MLPPGPDKDLASQVARFLHSEKPLEAAAAVADFFRVPFKTRSHDSTQAWPILTPYLHELLENKGREEAAQMLWTPNQFTCEPSSVKQVWSLVDESPMFLIEGAAKMGKSFSVGVYFFLEWIRDPRYTTIRVLGPSEDHLEANLFSHLVNLHTQASIPMPGEIGELFIGLTRRNQVSAIKGVVIPKGNNIKAGRLQGGHRVPRPVPHPIFGPLSRMFLFLDEIENIPKGVWKDVDNVLSEIEEKGAQGFKIGGAYNPTNPYDEVGKRAEPGFGWEGVNPDEHFRWKSKRGWDVLRLDGERSENVIAGRIIFPGLQTRAGLEAIALNAGGRNAPGYQTMGRGMYPSMGIEATVIPSGMFPKWKGDFIWYEDPQPVAATDLALDGGDEAVHTLGLFGRATGIKYPPSIEFPAGRTLMFKDRMGQVIPRWGLQATQQFALPKGDTIVMKEAVISLNRKAGVKGDFYACDRTGHGRGVADLIKWEWSQIIHDINYSQSASESKLMAEDTKTCKEQYDRMVTELWFALRCWGEFNYFLISPAMDLMKLAPQLTQRNFKSNGGKTKVEAKREYMSRGFGSPNEADSLTLLVHAARKGSGLILSMRGDSVELPGGELDESWMEARYPGGARIDESNRHDYLDLSAVIPGEMGEEW